MFSFKLRPSPAHPRSSTDEESPPASPGGEINRAVSQLEDVNPGTWSGRMPQSLPGMSPLTPAHHAAAAYLATSRQRASMGSHILPTDKEATPVNKNDGDDKSVKSECLPMKGAGKNST